MTSELRIVVVFVSALIFLLIAIAVLQIIGANVSEPQGSLKTISVAGGEVRIICTQGQLGQGESRFRVRIEASQLQFRAYEEQVGVLPVFIYKGNAIAVQGDPINIEGEDTPTYDFSTPEFEYVSAQPKSPNEMLVITLSSNELCRSVARPGHSDLDAFLVQCGESLVATTSVTATLSGTCGTFVQRPTAWRLRDEAGSLDDDEGWLSIKEGGFELRFRLTEVREGYLGTLRFTLLVESRHGDEWIAMESCAGEGSSLLLAGAQGSGGSSGACDLDDVYDPKTSYRPFTTSSDDFLISVAAVDEDAKTLTISAKQQWHAEWRIAGQTPGTFKTFDAPVTRRGMIDYVTIGGDNEPVFTITMQSSPSPEAAQKSEWYNMDCSAFGRSLVLSREGQEQTCTIDSYETEKKEFGVKLLSIDKQSKLIALEVT